MRLLWPQSFYLENVLQKSKYKIFYSNVLMVLLSNCIKIFKCKRGQHTKSILMVVKARSDKTR